MFLWRNEKNVDIFQLKKCHVWSFAYFRALTSALFNTNLTLVMLNKLTLVLLNKLRCHAYFQFSANQITWSNLLIQINILNGKQCRSRSVGFFRSQLIWIYTVCKDKVYPGSAGLGLRCHTPHRLLIFSQLDHLVLVVDINSHTWWQQCRSRKATDLDLHCLQRQVISTISRTRVKASGTWVGQLSLSVGWENASEQGLQAILFNP